MEDKTKQLQDLDSCTNHSTSSAGETTSFIDEDDFLTSDLVRTLAQKETKAVNILRLLALVVLLWTGVLVSTVTYSHLRKEEQSDFEMHFGYNAAQVIESFHTFVERTMGAAAGLSNQITSHALETNSQFPFVTLPNYEMRGSHVRAQSGSHLVYYAPIVTDDTRSRWEEYALNNRHQVLQARSFENEYRCQQDTNFGLVLGNETCANTESNPLMPPKDPLITVLEDGYHPHIPTGGAVKPRRDQEIGAGPFAPLWHQSPVYATSLSQMNNDLGTAGLVAPGIIEMVQQEKKAIINPAAVPVPHYRAPNEMLLRVSQYRHRVEDFIDDLHTWLVHPVFDSFNEATRSVAGIVVTDVYWKILFSNLLPSHTKGIVCVVSNSFGQNFTYRLDGGHAELLGMGDHHDERYEGMVVSTNVGSFLEGRASPANMAYGAVPLSKTTEYNIRVYPSRDIEAAHLTNTPLLYTTIISLIFLFTIVLVYSFAFVVDRRQTIMTRKVVEKSERMAKLEQNLNEFYSHEIRNPLASALTAASFLQSSLQDPDPTAESKKLARDDIEVVTSSLQFINDFMRSMLDIYRAASGRITVEKSPTDVKIDILEPVAAIIRQRGANYEVLVECPDNLMIMTDRLRLNQIVLNLARNSTKFVEVGFVRLRAVVNPQNKHVILYVEDTGPGVPHEKRKRLFSRYQPSLDLLHQGTGIGLNLSKQLCTILGGNVWLDNKYESGFRSDCPGARFVIDMQTAPLDLEVAFLEHSFSFSSFHEPSLEVEEETDTNEFHLASPLIAEIDTSGVADKSAPLFQIDVGQDLTTSEDQVGVKHQPVSSETGLVRRVSSTQRLSKKARRGSSIRSSFILLRTEVCPNCVLTELPEELSILFVDDDPLIRKLFMRAIQKVAQPSWKMEDASSGEMALKMCESNEYSIIFLDQYMASVSKQLTGTETAISMRMRGIKSKICGLSANELADAFKRAGAEEFILKPLPCSPPKLKSALLDILNLPRFDAAHEKGCHNSS